MMEIEIQMFLEETFGFVGWKKFKPGMQVFLQGISEFHSVEFEFN
jgi:hypothetical protein